MDFQELLNEIKNCRICEEKFGFTPNPVIWGSESSKIVQISQAPSKNVHASSKPFTDLSGNTLKYKWYQITDEEFYNKNNFYISSLAHCYPGKNKNGGDNLPPKCCYQKWIKKELSYINNELYIIVGASSAKVFFPNEKFEDLVFKDNILYGKKAIVLPHPSPLNRRWLIKHPEFLEKRIVEVRKCIKDVIKGES